MRCECMYSNILCIEIRVFSNRRIYKMDNKYIWKAQTGGNGFPKGIFKTCRSWLEKCRWILLCMTLTLSCDGRAGVELGLKRTRWGLEEELLRWKAHPSRSSESVPAHHQEHYLQKRWQGAFGSLMNGPRSPLSSAGRWGRTGPYLAAAAGAPLESGGKCLLFVTRWAPSVWQHKWTRMRAKFGEQSKKTNSKKVLRNLTM